MSRQRKASDMTDVKTTRALRGKTIKSVKVHAFYDQERCDYLYDPTIEFNDGTCLRFVVEEGSVEHGVSFIIHKPTAPTGDNQ